VFKSALALACTTLLAAGSAQAGVVDLDLHGANVFALTDFKPPAPMWKVRYWRGAISLSHYSVNDKNFDAYGSYSLIAGRNLSFGSFIKNGYTYVGGSANVTQSVDDVRQKSGRVLPCTGQSDGAGDPEIDFSSLSTLATTGSATVQWGGLNITGSKSKVEVIDIDAKTLSSVTTALQQPEQRFYPDL
jgi:hypothetical protein